MNYLIIRNEKYAYDKINKLYFHNERKLKKYSNKDINKDKTYLNYNFIKPKDSYLKEFDRIIKSFNVINRLNKNNYLICEYIITASNEYFKLINKNEERRFFNDAYNFVKKYRGLEEKFIISAVVHLDETTPHMHIVYLPIIKEKSNLILSPSKFWNGINSYKILQNDFYSYMHERNFNVIRGKNRNSKAIPINVLKEITNFENLKFELENNSIEKKSFSNFEELYEEYKKIIVYNERLKKQILKIPILINEVDKLKNINNQILDENKKLEENYTQLINYKNEMTKTVYYLFGFKEKHLEEVVKNIINEEKLDKDLDRDL